MPRFPSQSIAFFNERIDVGSNTYSRGRDVSKICRVWSKPEIEFLLENYKEHGAGWVAHRLERTINSVRIQACYLNQSRRNERKTPLGRVKAMTRGQNVEVISAPAGPPQSAAVIATAFIRPLTKAELMRGRA